MNPNIIKTIVDGQIPCFFISPHPDDAALCAGGLINYLSQRTRIEVINIFTKPSEPPYTFSTKRMLALCGYENADKLFEDRIAEDAKAFSTLNIKIRNLGFVDAPWRKFNSTSNFRRLISNFIPEFIHIYPIYRFNIIGGKISRCDNELMQMIGSELKDIILKYKEYYVFCPLGIGNHVDHLIARDVCMKNLNNVILWSDFPYNDRIKLRQGLMGNSAEELFKWDMNLAKKRIMIKKYKTQFNGLFPDGNIPSIPEIFYTSNLNKK